MARRGGAYGLVGLTVVFVVILLAIPFVKSFFGPSIVSGFEDMQCEEGRKPCPEGYFCEQRACVPVLPKFNVDQVQPGSE